MHRITCKLLFLVFAMSLAAESHAWNFVVEQVTFNSTQDWSSTIAVDDSNKVHILYRHIDEVGGDAEIFYASNASGSWSSERVTDNAVTDNPAGIAVTPAGSPHVGYTGNNEKKVYYAKKDAGSWVLDPVVPNSNYKTGGSIALGPDSTPNLAYFQLTPDTARIYYATHVSGEWQIDAIPNSDSASPGALLALDSNDKAHIVFEQRLGGNPDVYYTTNKTGEWQTTNITNDTAVEGSASLGLDVNDFVHVVFTRHDEIYYGNNCTGQFQFEQVTDNAVSDRLPSLCIDENGSAHIICHETPAVGHIYYYTNAPGYWEQVPVYTQAGNKSLSARNIVIDRNGYAHATFCAGGANTEVYHAVSDSVVVGIENRVSPVTNIYGSLQVMPNPASTILKIRFTTPDPLKVKMNLYDVTGRLVRKILDGNAKVGMNEFLIVPGDLSTGVFFVRLKQDKEVTTQKIVIME